MLGKGEEERALEALPFVRGGKEGLSCPVPGGDAAGCRAAWIPGPLFPASGPCLLTPQRPLAAGRQGLGVQLCGRPVPAGGSPCPSCREKAVLSADRAELHPAPGTSGQSHVRAQEWGDLEGGRGGDAVGGEWEGQLT